MSKTEKLTTPKGELEWVFIDGEGKENLSGKAQYVANLVLDEKTSAVFAEKIKDFWEENKPAGFKKEPKSLGAYPHKVKQGDEQVETGKTVFAFKTGITYADGTPKKIDIYNAKANKVSLGDKKIGNGSKGCISGAMGIYTNTTPQGKVLDAGVTLYLNAIQLTHFVPFSADAGFAVAEEDGWTGEDEESGFEPQGEEQAKPRL